MADINKWKNYLKVWELTNLIPVFEGKVNF